MSDELRHRFDEGLHGVRNEHQLLRVGIGLEPALDRLDRFGHLIEPNLQHADHLHIAVCLDRIARGLALILWRREGLELRD